MQRVYVLNYSSSRFIGGGFASFDRNFVWSFNNSPHIVNKMAMVIPPHISFTALEPITLNFYQHTGENSADQTSGLIGTDCGLICLKHVGKTGIPEIVRKVRK